MADLLERYVLAMHRERTVCLIISGFRLKKEERMRYSYFFLSFLAYNIFILNSKKQLLSHIKTPAKDSTFSVWEFLYMNSKLQNENKLKQ